jgi:hypothetical protein
MPHLHTTASHVAPARFAPTALTLALALAATVAHAQASTAVAARDAAVTLADSAVTLPFVVARDGDTATAVSVRYTTVDGSAQAGADYRPASGIATIPAGKRSTTIPVTVLGQPAADRQAGQLQLRLQGAFAVAAPVDTLALATVATGRTAGHVWGMASADFNADGRPDLALANNDDGTVDIFGNATAAGAAAPVLKPAVSLGHLGGPVRPLACDLNNDGRPDLAVASQNTNQLSVYLNTTAPGARRFSFERSDLVSLPWGWLTQMACADVDGDGRLDLLGSGSGSNSAPDTNRLIVFRNLTAAGATAPSFAPPVGFAAHPNHGRSMPETIVAGDFNADGRPDVALGHFATNDATVMLNATPAGSAELAFGTPVVVRTLEAPSDMAVLDVDGDGRLDVATANGIGGQGGGTWALLMNRTAPGSATPSFVPSVRFIGGAPYGLAVADMDLDGRPDVLVTLLAGTDTNDGSVSVLLNRAEPGDNNPPFLFANSVPAGDEPHAIAAADFNQDGLPDFARADNRIGAQPIGVVTQSRSVQPLKLRKPAATGSLAP